MGDEDHIGALSVALQAAPAPVYGSRLTLGFVERRLRERGIEADLRTLRPGQAELGPLRLNPIRVAHSVLDSLALAIETPAGVVLASGDFKLGADAPPEERTDVDALAEWGRRVLVAVGQHQRRGERPHAGRRHGARAARSSSARGDASSSPASRLRPLQRVADLASEFGRRLGLIGRRMADNADVAMGLGLLRVPPSALVAPAAAAAAPASLALLVAGSQGEPLSALSLVSVGEHRDVAVGPGDTVVFSSRAIPGNERSVSRVISNCIAAAATSSIPARPRCTSPATAARRTSSS